jgi:hypothetical protein
VQDDDGPRGLERVARPVRWRQPVPANEASPPFDRIKPAHGDTSTGVTRVRPRVRRFSGPATHPSGATFDTCRNQRVDCRVP